jgi:crotonobetainyl-CoA:carnitine CoA-transferase CaiB-like acyl-CoA transferase
MNEVGVPCGPVYTIDQTFADPQVQHLEIARPVDHPKLGPIKVVGQAINMTRTPEVGKAPPDTRSRSAYRRSAARTRLQRVGDRRSARPRSGLRGAPHPSGEAHQQSSKPELISSDPLGCL